MKRKLIVWLMTLAMLATLLPQTALFAAGNPWDGYHFMPTLSLTNGTGGTSYGTYTPSRLLDDSTSSSWCVSDIYNKTVYIEFSAQTSFTPAGYALTTANNAADTNGARNPTCWTLKGKLNNSDDWTVLAEVENDATLPAENGKVVGFSVEHPMRCQFFRWEITAVKEGDTFQMAELILYGAIGLQIPARPATCTEVGYTVDCWKDTASGLYYAEDTLKTLLDTSAVEIPALGHTLTYHPVTAADSSAFWSCSTCGKFFSDANCETEVTGYLDEAGTAHIRDVYTPITETTTELTTGWYAVTSDLGIDSRITCNGDVHLILFNGATLNAVKGITVNKESSLTIYAQSADENKMGALTVSTPDQYCAGIGHGDHTPAGIITINGGKVTATGGEEGTGIGGGGSTVTVNGGTVTATGGFHSGGLGGNHSTVTVNGGKVEATGGVGGAGIGSDAYSARIYGCTITVNGGIVTANGGDRSAGIGGGDNGSGGTVTVNGGTVRANGGWRASGIGSGENGNTGTILLRWTSPTDSITASSYCGTVKLRRPFRNGTGGTFYGEIPNNTDISGVTLLPYQHEHALQHFEATAPTCEQTGHTEHWYCATCDRRYSDCDGFFEIAEAAWFLPATGHDLTEHAAVEASSTTAGNSAYWSCSVCGKYFSDANGENEIAENSWLIASLGGHTLTFHAAVPESDTEAGNTAYWSCSACGKYFSDEDGTQEIPKNSWILSAYYLDASGDLQKRSSGAYTPVTGNTTTLTTGWYAVKYDVEIGSRISCHGDVHLILCDGAALTAARGITVNEGNSLTVYAQSTDAATMGALVFSAPNAYDAGIGAGGGNSAGVITINGGAVTAAGGAYAAGIGGTYNGAAGTVTVNGGIVSATGGAYAAGIGAGDSGAGSTVSILGGTVRATGGACAAGIGAGAGAAGGTISLSWTNENDSINASSYNGTVTLQKVFTDGTNIYDAGVITNLSALAGKTLRKPEFFTVWWKDDDGTPLETDENVPYGTTPVYHGQTPVKPYDTSVAFSGWSPEITAATSNATYTAVYNSVVPVGSYIIYVNTPDNVTLTLVVNEDDTVNSVKAKIQGLLGTVTQRQSLIFAGKVLEDGRILDDYNIQNESTLRLVYHNPFTGHSLSLEGEIGLNFYVSLTDEEIDSGAKVNFSWTVESAEKTDSVTLTAADRTDDGYKTSVPLPVAELTYDVTATVVVDGVELATDTYSVKEYADTILSDDYKTAYLAQNHTQEDYTKLENLIKTMLIYGARAQINFERNTDNLADDGLSYTMQKVTVDMIPSTASDMSEGLGAYGLQYAGTTLVYLAKTSMRHYYTITDETLFNAVKDDITFNGEKVSYQTKDGKIYFELKNIAAADLDTVYTLRIGTNEYQSSGLDYVRNCLLASNAPYNTKQLVMATYWYNQAANAYFGR